MDTEAIWKRLVTAASVPGTIESDRVRRALLSEAMTVGSTITRDSLGCSITESVGAGYRTPVASNSLALDLDGAQYADDDGPCIAACRDGGVHSITVMADERDYREFVQVALEHGVRSSLSLPLAAVRRPSALNLYAGSASAFDDPRARAVAHLLARCAAAVLTADPFAAVRRDASGHTAVAQHGDLRTEPGRTADAVTIANALRVLGEQHGLDRPQAFAELRRRSLAQGIGVAAAAQDVVRRAGPGSAR